MVKVTIREIFTHSMAAIVAVVAVLTLWKPTPDSKDFDGLRIQAAIDDQARTRLTIPVTYQNGPVAMFASGSVVDSDNPTGVPSSFTVRLAAINESSTSEIKTILYEDLRPVVCEKFGGNDQCGNLTIVNISIQADFARGPKQVNLYEHNPIDLM